MIRYFFIKNMERIVILPQVQSIIKIRPQIIRFKDPNANYLLFLL